jgi:CRISPR/Cas system CSM-associated protein Csm3 (group 7 of RAMP superfamily)
LEAKRKELGDCIVQEIENYALSQESIEQIADGYRRIALTRFLVRDYGVGGKNTGGYGMVGETGFVRMLGG